MNNNAEIQNVKNRFGIIGNAPSLNIALSVAVQVASTDLSVLISGESGSGKESFSKIIHGLSPRKHGNFIAINCGAIPEGTIDSELFGHLKGSFTGAVDDRKGYFEITDDGTIFLDEIGEMPLGTQARLLRVLENGEYISVGSSKVKKTNVRVIAATNVNLLDAVNKGTFREDLYYRLNTVPIKVPPLRERGYDIELLFLKFTTDFAEKNRIDPVELVESGSNALLNYRFPGNIRQLKNIAEQITLLESERVINEAVIKKYLPKEFVNTLPSIMNQNSNSIDEREILYKVLFDLRADVTEMKKIVLNLLSGASKNDIIKNHQGLFDTIEKDRNSKLLSTFSESTYEDSNEIEFQESEPLVRHEILKIDNLQSQREDIKDVTHETQEEESLSLEKNEKELIIKALQKNKNKRKYAAQELGISERTLYRKIKQFDIEDEN